MIELTEAEQQKLNTARLMRAESEVILPFLQTKERLVVARIVSDFRAGRTDFLSHAAELATFDAMKNEIARKTKEAEALERKAYANE